MVPQLGGAESVLRSVLRVAGTPVDGVGLEPLGQRQLVDERQRLAHLPQGILENELRHRAPC
jgi:hypothetical protein